MAVTKKKTSKKAVTKKASSATKKSAAGQTAKKASGLKSASKAKTSSSKKATSVKTSSKVATKKSPKAKPVKVPSVASKKSLQVGDKVPDFIAAATKGTINLKDFKGKNLVIYFYPKDHTPGCTVEGHDFSKAQKKFAALNTTVLGVSRDSLSSHEKFIEKQSYTIDLISDPEEALCHLFGVMKEKSLYGRKYIGIDRSTFLIDGKGKVAQVWRNIKIPGHVDEVLAAVKAL